MECYLSQLLSRSSQGICHHESVPATALWHSWLPPFRASHLLSAEDCGMAEGTRQGRSQAFLSSRLSGKRLAGSECSNNESKLSHSQSFSPLRTGTWMFLASKPLLMKGLKSSKMNIPLLKIVFHKTLLLEMFKKKGFWAQVNWDCCTPPWVSQVAGTVVRNLPAHAEDAGNLGSIPGLRRSLRVGNSNLLQYSCLENSMDRGDWQAKSTGSQRVRQSWAHRHTHTHTHIDTHLTHHHISWSRA